MKYVFIASLLLSMGSTIFAAPCSPGNLQNLIDLRADGCQVGAVTFSNFQIVPGQTDATVISPAQVRFTPGGSAFNPSLMLTLQNPIATTGRFLESIFRFSVSGAPLTEASIAVTGSATRDGLVLGVLNVCPGARFTSNAIDGCPPAVTAIALLNSEESTGRLLASFFDVFVDLTLDARPRGTATLTSATVGISAERGAVAAIPEPSAALMLAAGLAALAGLKARRT